MTTTIWKSFRLALPEFPQFGDQIDTPPKDSGSTTAQCTPPRCGIRIPIHHWFDLASRLCLEIHSEQLKTKYLPEIDNFIAFKSEADVVNASTLYLTNPVHAAYQLVHQGDHHLDELIRPPKDTTPSSRCDRAYFSGRPNNEKRPGNSTNVFAVLEYKKFEGLSRDEFDRGIVPNYDRYARAMEDPLFDHSDAKVQTVLRQATHYATIFKTPFVALCDYNTLILLVMTKVGQFQGGEVSAYRYSDLCRTESLILHLASVHLPDHRPGLKNDAEGVFGVPSGGQVVPSVRPRDSLRVAKESHG